VSAELPELIDTHAHLYAEQFDEDRMDVLHRAKAQGITHIFLPNIDHTSISPMMELAATDPGHLHPMMGLHPCSVTGYYQKELEVVEQWLAKASFCAIGEIGVDLYWDKTWQKEQEQAFLKQVNWAIDLDIPIIIHSRESIDLIIELLKPLKSSRLRGIFHCFSGSQEQAKAIMDLGFLMGIGGVLTFKKAGLDQVIPQIPLDYLVLETDAPYLAPTPYRGKRNESAYTRIVAEKMAEVLKIDLEEVAKITTANAKMLFGIKEKKQNL
jgi:TatD DNase family protein